MGRKFLGTKKDVFAWQGCWRKRKYETREDAQQHTQSGYPRWRVYKCKHCGGFHRATPKNKKA